MKNLIKITLLLICFFTCNLDAVAGDTIRFCTRVAGWESHGITATLNKQFTVDWGDGSPMDTFTGTGVAQSLFHAYPFNPGRYKVTIAGSEDCFFTYFRSTGADTLDLSSCPSIINLVAATIAFGGVQSLNASNCKKLEVISAGNGRLSVLDLTDCIVLKDLFCQENNLTHIDLASIEYVSPRENRLPLSELYKLSEMISNPNNKLLGRQAYYQRIAVGDPIDFSTQTEFGGIQTVFRIEQGGSPAPLSNYTLENGIITFHQNGNYTIIMTNDAIISHIMWPAVVVVSVLAVIFVAVDEIINVPAMATVGVPLLLEGTVLPSNATNTYITWSMYDAGATGATLTGRRLDATAPGTVIVTATVTEGAAIGTPYTQNFAIEVRPLSINEPAQELSGVQVFPNPTTGELVIMFDELQATSDELRVTIFDVSGKTVAAHHFMFLPARQKIDISHLNNGIYFVKIATGQGEVVKKVIKQ
ncbi:MAG: T9SS type A sorting domain-containing protein [Bacteroidetes bacterium]|nr:T9SS type A sorting domain-containing protein [Bacteroidota bacterium]MCL2303637.1 T9SS type A sorting domain-containing protein [Lentimicrobiaceae bacterium]